MKLLVINNLNSGLHDGAIFEFLRKFARDGDEVALRCTDGTTSVESLLDDATAFDMVVAAGGDGTIATVCYALRYTKIPILPFPAGTGNLLAANLDQPDEPYAIATMTRNPHCLDFDLGEVIFADANHASTPVTKGFAIIAGAGYDATIIESSEKLKESLGAAAYVAAALVKPNPTMAHFCITLDDRTVEIDGIGVLIMNFAKISPDISITHGNDARDGLLEVAVIKTHNAVELLPGIIAALLDRDGGFPSRADAITSFTSRNVHIAADPPLHIQYDGETPGVTTPLSARVLPAATRLVLTKEEYRRLNELG